MGFLSFFMLGHPKIRSTKWSACCCCSWMLLLLAVAIFAVCLIINGKPYKFIYQRENVHVKIDEQRNEAGRIRVPPANGDKNKVEWK